MDSSVFDTSLLVVGSEPVLVERAIAERIQAAHAERPGAEVVDLGASDLADGRFAEAVGGSLFAQSTVVVVRELGAVPEEQADLVVETARRPGPELCLALAHGGGVAGRAFADRVGKAVTQRIQVDALKARELPGYVQAEARRVNLRLDGPAAQALVEAVGNDLAALSGAVAQLASDWGDARLDASMVNRYFSGRADVTRYAVADDAIAGRCDRAMEKLRWALAVGVTPVDITGALAGGLRTLGRYLDLRGGQLPAPELARQVGVPAWKLKDLAIQARAWNPGALAQAILATARADAQVKGAATDADYALERLLLTLDRVRRAG